MSDTTLQTLSIATISTLLSQLFREPSKKTLLQESQVLECGRTLFKPTHN